MTVYDTYVSKQAQHNLIYQIVTCHGVYENLSWRMMDLLFCDMIQFWLNFIS